MITVSWEEFTRGICSWRPHIIRDKFRNTNVILAELSLCETGRWGREQFENSGEEERPPWEAANGNMTKNTGFVGNSAV
jgi:hypothetical protein